MPLPPPSLVGSVVERSPSSSSSFNSVSSPSASPLGFPSAQHRSKSAFARAREARRNGTQYSETARTREVPIVRNSGIFLSSSRGRRDEVPLASDGLCGPSKESSSNAESKEDWTAQMRRDNDRAIEAMSGEERERHAAEILEQLGPNVGDLLQKAREARARAEAGPEPHGKGPDTKKLGDGERQDIHQVTTNSHSNVKLAQPTPTASISKTKFVPPRSILSQPSSRSSSPGRNARKLRFADVTPKDVHVFQSEPSSPRRPLGLLLPPPPDGEGEAKDVEEVPTLQPEPSPEEGTPEYIRRHFFPEALRKDPALEWIESDDTVAEPDSELRFDLTGTVIPLSIRESLPTHLGLHHHGGSSAAGYTLSELYLLARSSVPAQRATVLSVLSKIVRRLAHQEHGTSEVNDRDNMRSKALVLGLAAIAEKGTVGVQAIELVWSCVVYWDEEDVEGLDGVELRQANAKVAEETRTGDSLPAGDPISSLPFSALLPQIAVLVESRSLPPESQSQLLSILHRFARHSVEMATALCETPQLLASVINTFLLTPIPPPEHGPLPNPLTLDLLQILALSYRANARTIEGPADALLRFVTTAVPLSASPFPRLLSDALLRRTLDLYTMLAKYGLYCGVAITAAEHFSRLSSSILQSSDEASVELKVSWLRLISVWMVCARDPHRMTPAHDLLWSQVTGWAWSDEILEFRRSLLCQPSASDKRLWAAVWDSLASWLEGCRVNTAKAGQDERDAVDAAMQQSWTNGIEKLIVTETIAQLKQELRSDFSENVSLSQQRDNLGCVAKLSRTLADFTRLCLACLPKHAPGSGQDTFGPDSPSWILDAIDLLLPAASELMSSDILRSIGRTKDSRRNDLLFRAQVLYMRTASSFLSSFMKLLRALPGNTACLQWVLATLQTLLPGDEESTIWLVGEIINKECAQIECANKLQFLVPFFKNMIRPDDAFYLAPLSPTPESIQLSTTQCLPANYISGSSARPGLPFSPDWPCVALDHLLRSGTSPILTNPDSVPDSWNASETDLTQASLALMLHVRTGLRRGSCVEFAPSFEHVVFNCMKVFMLEHNQQQSDSDEEVFRDPTVERLMHALLVPYTLRGSQSDTASSSSNLEIVAKGFLGDGTPFFQFYTDFVALYDSISFSHPIFAQLLLPPTSMAYALDYRKLLWGDFGHTLRTVRTPIEDVASPDLKQFFWPMETDAEMLGWYLRALVKWPLDGFVRFVAVHHLACGIWPDLRHGEDTIPAREKRRQMLLVAVFNQAKSDVAKDIVRYVQDVRDDLQLPPMCYDVKEETKVARLAFVRGLGETRIVEGMENIFGKQI